MDASDEGASRVREGNYAVRLIPPYRGNDLDKRLGEFTLNRLTRSLSEWQAIFRAPRDSSELLLSQYFEEYVEHGKPGIPHILRRPRKSVAALIALYRQPQLNAVLSQTVEGSAIYRNLDRRSIVGRTAVHSATSVLVLPDRPGEYDQGAAKQTLRRKARKAKAQGVHWMQIDDPQQRQDLLDLAHESERNHPLADYRESNPDNTDLLDYKLWLVAYSADDRPLLLSVTPIDGEWALLRYFRTLGGGEDYSNSRYLMTHVLVEHLVGAGVRYLADVSSPVGLPNGLRHFQRMLGFRVCRIRVKQDGPAPVTEAPQHVAEPRP